MVRHAYTLRRPFSSIVGIAFTSFLVGCGGGGTPGTTILKALTAPGSVQQDATATFVISWPTGTQASPSARHREYISPSTKSITISINGGTPIVIPNPNVGNTGTPSPSTTTTVPAPIGNDTFTVGDYDNVAGNVAGSNLLAQSAVPYTIVAGVLNTVPITLVGNLASVACVGVAPFVSGTAPAFAEVGPAGEIAIVSKDPDGNIIVGPGLPTITLGAANAAQGTVETTPTTNLFTVNPLLIGTAVTFNASGTSLAGATFTTSCNVTRQLAMYIANHTADTLAGGSAPTSTQGQSIGTVTIYPASATGSATPTATIGGSNTGLNAVYFPALDAKGDLFVSNQGPAPGHPLGIRSGYVSIFAPAAHGNVAPMSSISGIGEPQGLAFDSNGLLYVSEVDRIEEYPPTANGVTAAAVPNNTITGPSTFLGCYGMVVGTDFSIYLACAQALVSFPPKSTGNQAPGLVSSVGTVVAAGMTIFSTQSWQSVSLDAANNLALPGFNNNTEQVSVYPTSALPCPGANATPVPTLGKDVLFNQPFGIAVDVNGQYYVTNFGNNTVEVFTSLTTMEAGVSTNLTLTGLDKPYGIVVI